MKTSPFGFSKFITYSFICHIIISIFLVIYAQDYEQKQKLAEEKQEEEDRQKEENELKEDVEEILREIVEEKDEAKKEEIVEELKEKIWEELKEEKEELLAEKKEEEKEKYLEKLAEEVLDAKEELKKKEEEEEKKKELIDELVLKDLPEIEKKIEEEVKNKSVEELEKEALKETLTELKKIAEEQIKPVIEKNNDSFLKKMEELIKQIEDTTKTNDQASLQEEIKKILEKTDEITDKAEEINKKFEEASESFKKDQLDVALDVFKDKEAAVEEKKEAIIEAYQNLTENEKKQSDFTKLPETEKEWDKAIQKIQDAVKAEDQKKPETPTLLTKPLEELAKLDAEKDKAEKVLKEIMKDELVDAKKATEESKQLVTTASEKKQVEGLQKELEKAAEKSESKHSKEFKEAAEAIQGVKQSLPEIVKNTEKATKPVTPAEPLDVAVNNVKEKEQAIEKKKEEVLSEIKKATTDEKNTPTEKQNVIKTPESEKDWKKMVDQAKEASKNPAKANEVKTPLDKSISELAQKEAEKDKAVADLKQLEKTQLAEVKKAKAELEKTAKADESKKQLSELQKKIEKADKASDSANTKEVKESAEMIKAVKKEIPEIAKNENAPGKDPEDLKNALEVAKKLLDKSIEDLDELKTGKEASKEAPANEKIESKLAKADDLLKKIKEAKTENNTNKFTDEQIKEPKEAIEKAQGIINELKRETSKEEQFIKKEIESLKKNMSEKEKKENKDAMANLDVAEKNMSQAKSLEPKLDAMDTAEAKLDEIKSNINEQRKDSVEKNQDQIQKVKDLAKEIAEGMKKPADQKSKSDIVAQIESQAMEDLTQKKAESFESFLAENDSNNSEEQVKEFKEDAKNSVDAAIQENAVKKNSKENADKNSNEQASAEDENNTDENSESGEEEAGAEDGEKSKSKGKGKGEKGKGKGKGKPGDQENSALAKAIAEKLEGSDKEGKGEGKGKSDENDQSEKSKLQGKGNGQKLDGGGDKTAVEIVQNILYRNKSFKKAIVTEEDEKRIFTENINYEAIRIPPAISFAKPTANGLPLEPRELSTEIFIGQDQPKHKAIEKPKNQERDRVKHEKFTKGNFAAVPYLKAKPVIDGKNNDWQLDKSWIKSDKQIAMGWRSDGLYFFATIRDRTNAFEKADPAEMFATWWRFDSVELWIDMQNSKSDDTNKFDCQQFTFWPALQNIRNEAELYEVLWGKRAKSQSTKERKIPLKNGSQTYVASKEHADHRGYDIEVFIPCDHLLNREYFKGGQVAGFIYIINHGNLVEDSSLEFYKEGYDGYSTHPSSWGNIQLLGTDAKIDQINADKKVIQEKMVEVSTNLMLQVTDQDSNQNPNSVDKVTIRVKNENNFDGKKSEDTDWEDVLLTETGKDTGVFTGTITLTVAPSKPDDNALCAQAGDIIHAYFNDHIQVAGEYDEKMHLKIKVVPPFVTVSGKLKK